jgi:cell division inhibitor SepF
MGVLDKFLNVMRLNPDDDEDDFYNEDYEEDDDYEEPIKRKPSRKEKEVEFAYSEDRRVSAVKEKPVKTSPKVTPMRTTKRQVTGMEVCVIRPNTVEDAREITETLLMNRTVVLNLEGLDMEIAQRIIDFTSGSCFAVSGNLQKISNYIFIITPQDVDISGDFLSIVDSLDTSKIRTDF